MEVLRSKPLEQVVGVMVLVVVVSVVVAVGWAVGWAIVNTSTLKRSVKSLFQEEVLLFGLRSTFISVPKLKQSKCAMDGTSRM